MFSLRRLLASFPEVWKTIRRSWREHAAVGLFEKQVVFSVLLVGPTHQYHLPSQAAAAARDGDVIKIEARTYPRDVAVWKANHLTIMGVKGRPKLDATDFAIPNRKAIWVIVGKNTKVDNIEFTGAHDAAGRDKNWAGIRQEGSTLTVTNCSFHHNDDGILTNAGDDSVITVSGSEFASNGFGDGYSHNLYIGHVKEFRLTFSSSRDAIKGHLVKSRAQTNHIVYNRLLNGAEGKSSYEIDLPNGGESAVVGNLIVQGRSAENSTILAYAEEGAKNAVQSLNVVNNTFVNSLGRGKFVSVSGKPRQVRLINNIFANGGTVLSGKGTLITNLVSNAPGFIDSARSNYGLAAKSPAINSGTKPGTAHGIDLTPAYQYSRRGWIARPKDNALDIGAYEH